MAFQNSGHALLQNLKIYCHILFQLWTTVRTTLSVVTMPRVSPVLGALTVSVPRGTQGSSASCPWTSACLPRALMAPPAATSSTPTPVSAHLDIQVTLSTLKMSFYCTRGTGRQGTLHDLTHKCHRVPGYRCGQTPMTHMYSAAIYFLH